MFERYTEKARRAVFFARYEASQFGSPYIETEHLLLGILREDKKLTNRFLRSFASVESIRKQIEAHTTIREKVATSVDLPISDECKRVMAYAAEESERLGNLHIGTEHLLLGILREESCFAAELLKERGVQIDSFREELVKAQHEAAAPAPAESKALISLFRDLTQAAAEGQLEPVVARDFELECIIEILSRRSKRNPILIGERGAGKAAIVEGLAQRIADGAVPQFLANKKILAIGPEVLAFWTRGKQSFDDLTKLLGSMVNPAEIILFIDGLRSPSKAAAPESLGALKFVLLNAEIQCISVASTSDYRDATQTIPCLTESFREVYVRPLDEAGILSVLQAVNRRLEKFYEVTYSDDALELVVSSASSYLPEGTLPAKALELLDAAGALVKVRQSATPD